MPSLCARPWNRRGESAYDPRGWSTLGRETAIQKVYWDADGWLRIEGAMAENLCRRPTDAISESAKDHSQYDAFKTATLDPNWEYAAGSVHRKMGTTGDGKLTLIGRGSLANTHNLSLIARRWQAFYFNAQS